MGDKYAPFVTHHLKTTDLKKELTELNAIFKAMKLEMLEVLEQIPNKTLQIEGHNIQMKARKKIAGMNYALVGEAFLQFFASKQHNSTVQDTDRDEFLSFIKEMRKARTETVVEVHCTAI
jgi:hypothetical protein